MPPIPPQVAQITCPNCGNVFRTPIYSLVDVGQQPELKQALLAGQLNLAACTQCGTAGMIGAPLIYHDAQKQVLFTYLPADLKPQEQELFIGEATNNYLIPSLPPNAPRGYLLTPRRFMSLTSLIDAIWEADGVPREVLEQQRKRVDLISQLASALDNEQQFQSLVEQVIDALDYEFFATLQAFIDAAEDEGRQDSVQLLSLLHNKLIEVTGFGQQGEGSNLAKFIEQLAEASEEELEDVIANSRAEIEYDYGFFQAWTAKIEALNQAGEVAEATRLTERRDEILEIVERMDKEAQELFEAGAAALREVLTAPDEREALQSLGPRLNEAFMVLLSANIAEAQRTKQPETVRKLENLSHLAIQIIQEQLPPAERLINQLMMSETTQESTTLLRQNAALVNPEFVKKLNEMADEREKYGFKPDAERLRQLAREAGALLF